jgi:hypothetical protein
MFFLEEDIICLEAQFWGVGLHLFARKVAAWHCTPNHHSSCVNNNIKNFHNGLFLNGEITIFIKKNGMACLSFNH